MMDKDPDPESSPPPKKMLRSTSTVRPPTTTPVLQKICVVCEKNTSFYKQKSKTVKAKMYTAQTKSAGKSLYQH